MSESNLPEWEQLLSAAAHLQEILPDATLVGGTAVAVFAQHRLSHDADHVKEICATIAANLFKRL